MKYAIAIILTILAGFIILDSLNAGHAFVMFFLAGVVPGTSIAIDAATMLEFFALAAGFVLSRVSLNAVRNFKGESISLQPAQA